MQEILRNLTCFDWGLWTIKCEDIWELGFGVWLSIINYGSLIIEMKLGIKIKTCLTDRVLWNFFSNNDHWRSVICIYISVWSWSWSWQ